MIKGLTGTQGVTVSGGDTTEQEIDFAIDLIQRKIARLRELSPLWEMFKDGIDLDTIQWASH